MQDRSIGESCTKVFTYWGIVPLGEEAEGVEDLLRCRRGLEGDEACDEEGVAEAALIERRFNECATAPVFFVDAGNGGSLGSLFCDERDGCSIALWSSST